MEIEPRKEPMKGKDFIFGFLLLGSCVEPFNAAIVNYDNLLVVEGLITDEMKQHEVRLTRTSRIGDSSFYPEQSAVVIIKANDGSSSTLTEFSPGIYKTPFMAGVHGTSYSLSIATSKGEHYRSEEVILKRSPPITKIYGTYTTDNPSFGVGIQLYLDTEDVRNATHYYRWEYESTYEIQTPLPSKFVWLGGNKITIRTVEVDNCWATDSSKTVMVQSTNSMASDRVTGFPIKFIAAESPELVVKYSILAKQYALNEKSYTFWKKLKEVNEQQGSLFDKQVGKVIGNISSTSNANENVLGFFDASGVSTRRSFFAKRQFPQYTPPLYLQSCLETAPITVPIGKLGETMEANKNTFLIADAGGDGPAVVFLARIACCDCTSRGTNLKPSFWE